MFYLAPHPKLDRPRRGSPRMFTIDWVEKYFSRVKPTHVVAIWVPVAILCLVRGVRDPATTAAGMVGLFALGLASWTLLEYLLHRYLFHFEPNPQSEVQVDVSWLIHGIHHDFPWDGDRLVMPPTATAVIIAALWIPMRLAFGVHYNVVFFAGILVGYIVYDLLHYWCHHSAPKSRLGKWLRRYHMVHHFSTPHERYGITTPIWDHVFGTYPNDKYSAMDQRADELEAKA
jgi:sterol desaturase/sphingolipid hydroxylase (fatty acid hydroxylase superfamily)